MAEVEDLNIARAHERLMIKALNTAKTQVKAAELLGITYRGMRIKMDELSIVKTKEGIFTKQQ